MKDKLPPISSSVPVGDNNRKTQEQKSEKTTPRVSDEHSKLSITSLQQHNTKESAPTTGRTTGKCSCVASVILLQRAL